MILYRHGKREHSSGDKNLGLIFQNRVLIIGMVFSGAYKVIKAYQKLNRQPVWERKALKQIY